MTLPAYTGVLTPADQQIITGIRDQWAAAVLSTASVDRAAAVEAVRRLYETNKLRQPALTIWMDSPLGCIYAAAVVGQLGEQLRKQFVNGSRVTSLSTSWDGGSGARSQASSGSSSGTSSEPG
jgi:hypothetical protein